MQGCLSIQKPGTILPKIVEQRSVEVECSSLIKVMVSYTINAQGRAVLLKIKILIKNPRNKRDFVFRPPDLDSISGSQILENLGGEQGFLLWEFIRNNTDHE